MALPTFSTLATLEVVAELVDRRRSRNITLATLEVVVKMLDMKMLDIAQRILDVDEQKLEGGAPGRTSKGRTTPSMDVTTSPAG